MKTPNIKFNLKFYDDNGGEEVVRTLDDLREEYNLSDLYDYYKSGVLGRWLTSIGHSDLAEALPAVGQNIGVEDTARSLLRGLGLAIDDLMVADVVRVEEQKSMSNRGNRHEQRNGGESKCYMALMSQLLSVACQPSSDGTYSVSSIQQCACQCTSIIRSLLRFHESGFANYIESEKYLPWWMNLILWSCVEIRPYVSHFRNLAVAFAEYADCKGVRWFGSFIKVRERTGDCNYISLEVPLTDVETFCTENFGWNFED